MKASCGPHFKEQHTRTKLIEAVCVKSGYGEGGRKAQRNADTHLLVGSPNLSRGRFRLLGRGAMRNSMEHSNHNSAALSPFPPSYLPFSFSHHSFTFSSCPLRALHLSCHLIILLLLLLLHCFCFSSLSLPEGSHKHLASCTFALSSEGSRMKKLLYFFPFFCWGINGLAPSWETNKSACRWAPNIIKKTMMFVRLWSKRVLIISFTDALLPPATPSSYPCSCNT